MESHEKVLLSIRQIIRAIDLRSKKLNKEFGLTSPQLLLMRTVQHSPKLTIRQLSKETNMSQATATSILDRLENRELIERQRDVVDKRKVHVLITTKGKTILNQAPKLLNEDFVNQFEDLESWEQTLIVSSLQRVSEMMNRSSVSDDTLSLNIDSKRSRQ
ncbi:MarR family winged helix-turn-helix transcriptional regulator [Vibrio zhugei]|uniref:MarR family winged helix-turn-helix transcriptional regulator n=1 Tax=Vibrio zhugei TaxID=2479546 RepID=A0ABV7C783_9VIBR|nr:MarR family winged helix-turn-helix transcriptional regulator [Vibrio zhugei]